MRTRSFPPLVILLLPTVSDYAGGMEERLHDLNNDPYETRHFTDDPDYSDRLAELREAFEAEWFPGVAHREHLENDNSERVIFGGS